MRQIAAIIIALLSAVPLAAQEYSTAPLRAPIAFPRDSIPTDPAGFIRWYGAEEIETPPEAQAALEHVYAMIGAAVKRRYIETGSAALPVGDTALARLFNIGTQLGAIGATEVVRAIGYREVAPSFRAIDPEFDVRFEGQRFALSTMKGRWRVEFPYYFMVGALERQQGEDGVPFDVAVISTLTAADSSRRNGASQATILIVSTESADLPAFAGSWLARLEISPTDTIPRLTPQATRSYRNPVPIERLWREMSVFRIPSGSMAVIYTGLDGTHQTNRQHYLDLLNSIRVR